jgi:CTP synthase (UTP-ammonia lyase)
MRTPIGDRDDNVVAHRAIPQALALAADVTGIPVEWEWLGTHTIGDGKTLHAFDALWCVPASPYREHGRCTHRHSLRTRSRRTVFGYLRRFSARGRRVRAECPGLGRCRTRRDRARRRAPRHRSAELRSGRSARCVQLKLGSRIADIYGKTRTEEGYHCNYGLGSGFREAIADHPLQVVAVDDQDDVRALELDNHPYFIATLFQHERAALQGICPPLVKAFVQVAADLELGGPLNPCIAPSASTKTPA